MRTDITRFASIVALSLLAPIFDPKSRLFDLEKVPRGLRNDATKGGDDPKQLLNQINQTFADFKAENDKLLEQVKKNGTESATTRQNVDALNARLTELQAKLDAAQKRSDDIESHVNRMGLGGGASGNDRTAKHVEQFNQVLAANGKVGDLDAERFGEFRKAQNAYIRRGDKVSGEMLNTLSVAATGEGYFVTPDTSGRIVTRLEELSPMRSLASVQTIGTDRLTGIYDNDDVACGWVAELEDRPVTDAGTDLGGWEIPVHEMYAQPEVTQQLLDDATIDVEAWLAARVARKFARTENAAFLTGNGVKKPRGILNYATAPEAANLAWGKVGFVKSGAAAAFAANNPGDAIIDLTYALKAGYRASARFLMARLTVAEVRKFKDTTGQYLWQPSLQLGQPATLAGYGISEFEDMPGVEANAFPIAFGDFREAYQIVDRQGIRTLRDPFTRKGRVKFYTTYRVGGGVINFEAIKLLKMSA